MKIKIASGTHRGRVRKANEDSLLVRHLAKGTSKIKRSHPFRVDEFGVLLAVADGMGGMKGGKTASNLAIHAIEEILNTFEFTTNPGTEEIRKLLDHIFLKAQALINEHGLKEPKHASMGTTLVVGLVKDKDAHVAWLGDSRCYHYNSYSGLKCLTADHSYVQMLLNDEVITKEEAFEHPFSNIILRGLTCSGKTENYPDHIFIKLQQGERLLFCSDGLNGMLRDVEIERILANEPDIYACLQQCISSANENEGRDNITVILVDVFIDLVGE